MVKQAKNIEIYPKRNLGRKSRHYLLDLRFHYKTGKITKSTYERFISQYYSGYL